MSDQASFLILLLLTPFWIFVTQLIFSWVLKLSKKSLNPLHVAAAAVFTTFAFTFVKGYPYVQSLRGTEESIPTLLYLILVYWGLAFSYFQFFAMTETARRIHILRELFTKGPTPLEDMEQKYGAEGVLSVRMERMVELKQLKLEGDVYKMDRKLILRVGQMMAFWAGVLGFRRD